MVYSGPVGPTDWHAHHAFQITLGLDAPILLLGREDQRPEACQVAVIPSDAEHRIDAGRMESVFFYVDPETIPGRRLRRVAAPTARASAWREHGSSLMTQTTRQRPLSWTEAAACRDDMLAGLLGEGCRPVPLHPALAQVRRWLCSQLNGGDVSLARAALEVDLSEGRLSHLFGEELGLGIRPFVLWLRLQKAAAELAAGQSLSTAAAAAGFADGAHLSRTFRRMFGLAPSDITRVATFVGPPGAL